MIKKNIIEEKLVITFLEINRIDTTNLKILKDNFNSFLEEEKFNLLLLDFENIEFIDSSALAFIISIYKKINKDNKKLELINVCSFVNKIFQITKIDTFIEIRTK